MQWSLRTPGDQVLFPWGPTLLPSDRMSHTILPGYLNCFGRFLFPATENLEYNYDYLKTSQIWHYVPVVDFQGSWEDQAETLKHSSWEGRLSSYLAWVEIPVLQLTGCVILDNLTSRCFSFLVCLQTQG